MQAVLTSNDFADWLAYYRVEPFGEDRADLRAGIIASVIANVNRDPKKRRRAFRPEDFIPKFDRKDERQPWQDQLKLVEMLNKALGGRDLRDKSGDDSDAADQH